MTVTMRQLKGDIRLLLADPEAEMEGVMAEIARYPGRRIANALIACFYDPKPLIRWRAIAALGRVTAGLARENMESARVVMRRLMWTLNDESGGIGWGAPEAMGEIMVMSPPLAGEFSHILRSYIRDDENFLEHEALQEGVIWGIGRLAERRPECLPDTAGHLVSFLFSPNPAHRGYAAWALGNLGENIPGLLSALSALTADSAAIDFFEDFQLKRMTVGGLASAAVQAGLSAAPT